MRLERNQTHARVMFHHLENQRPDAVIVPNGSMLEFGITFKVAEFLEIPVMSYEFGEQSERMWLAQDADVMRQDTSDLWNARGTVPLNDSEWERAKELFASRQGLPRGLFPVKAVCYQEVNYAP